MSITYEADFTPPAGDSDRIRAAAKLCGTLARDLHTDRGSADSAARTAEADWHGRRKDRFTRAAAGVQVQLDKVVKGLRSADTALAGFATALRKAQDDIHSYAVGLARDQNAYAKKMPQPSSPIGHQSHAKPANTPIDGKVTAFRGMGETYSSDWAADADAARKRLHHAAHIACSQLEDAIGSIVPGGKHSSAADLRRHVATALGISLTGTASGDDINTALNTAGKFLPPVPKKSNPAAVSRWWKSLSGTERDVLIKHDSSTVGNLNGVPSTARDKANRISLDNYIANAVFNPWEKSHLADAKKLKAAIGASATGSNTYLLGWTPDEGQGHAITSYGNPDTATNTSTLVGGMTTGLGNLSDYMGKSRTMWQQAKLSGAKRPAAITWWGYDAPPGIPQSADRKRADEGAPALDAFQTGLRATHHGDRSLNTVIGHSYGSVLVGDAAAHGRTLDADQIIFIGSPGVTVNHASDLHLKGVPASETAQHVFDGRAKNDIIQEVQPTKKYAWGAGVIVGLLPGPLPGTNQALGSWIISKDRASQNALGGDPWNARFGAQRFASDPGKSMPNPVSPYLLPAKLFFPGVPLGPKNFPTVDAHTGYWTVDNKSLLNMGSIIAGKGIVYAP